MSLSKGLKRTRLKLRTEISKKRLISSRNCHFLLKLAVFLLDDNRRSYSYPGGSSDRASEWRWDVADKDTIVAWGEQLKAEGILSDMFVISEMIKHGNSLVDIRQAAALQGADAVWSSTE